MARLRPLAIAAVILLFAFLGLALPDIDQPLPLDHRSALTHSILPAAAALLRRWARPIAAGLAFGIGLHLAADVFPNAMIGYATVKIPFAGALDPGASYAWLAVNSVACTALGAWLVRSALADASVRLLLLVVTAAVGAVYLLGTDGGWPALAIYAAVGWLAFRPLRGSEAFRIRPAAGRWRR